MDCEIIGYGYDGEGVGRLDGKVVFLPYALKGEIVEFCKEEEKSKFIKGCVKQICQESCQRRVSDCPYFGKCGGCTLQHAKYDYQLEIKKELLGSQLKKVGFCGDIKVVSSPKEFGYRNKIRLFVGNKGLSLKERGSNHLVAINKCLLVQDRINDAIEKINNFIMLQDLKNTIDEVVLREENNCILVNFIVNKSVDIDYQGLYLLLGDCGIFQTFKNECIHKVGFKSLCVKEMGLQCEFGMTSFHQVNAFLTEDLYNCIIENLVGDNIINCYSGAGVLSGVIAKQGKNVVGVELGKSEHIDAEKLKKLNGLSSLTNICGDCSEVLTKLNKHFDTIIVDPPRSGMKDSVCSALNTFDCQRFIYVSCNSATLVRDLQKIDSFKLSKVYLYDMFANTGEYEVVCILDRKNIH